MKGGRSLIQYKCVHDRKTQLILPDMLATELISKWNFRVAGCQYCITFYIWPHMGSQNSNLVTLHPFTERSLPN